jgi:hypothetical protein
MKPPRRRVCRVFPWTIGLVLLGLWADRSSGELLTPPFSHDYELVNLGSAPGVPAPYGGLTLEAGNPNVLLLGGHAHEQFSDGGIYAVDLTRGAGGHITGFSGQASLFASAPYIDGGLAYGPGGILFYSIRDNSWGLNDAIGEIKPGSSSPDKIVSNLFALSEGGGLGFANGGSTIRLTNFGSGAFVSAPLIADGTGTFGIGTITEASNGPLGHPEGFVTVPPGSPGFGLHGGMLMARWEFRGDSGITAYDLDGNGNPVVPYTERTFITGLSAPNGAFVDPITGDVLLSTNDGYLFEVRGFAPPAAAPEPSSLLVVITGTVGWLGYGWHKRRRVQAA